MAAAPVFAPHQPGELTEWVLQCLCLPANSASDDRALKLCMIPLPDWLCSMSPAVVCCGNMMPVSACACRTPWRGKR